MKRYFFFAILLAACVLGGGYLFQSKRSEPHAAPAGAPVSRMAPPTKEALPPLAPPVSVVGSDVPAWARGKEPGSKEQGSKAPEGARPAASGTGRLSPAAKAAAERLAALQGKKDVTPKEVAEALNDLEKANGSPVVGGVRLDVLRQNLMVADEMKSISEELQAMQQSGAMQTAEGRAKFAEKIKQIEQARGRLQTDFAAPGRMPGGTAKAGTTP